MKRPIIYLLGFMAAAGCAKLEHLDQLLTLKDLSEEGERLDRYVQKQNKNFDLLVETIKSGGITQYSTRRKILAHFGEPVLKEKIQTESAQGEKWLYRYAKQFFNGEKVYLYFDTEGKLLSWERVLSLAEGEKKI